MNARPLSRGVAHLSVIGLVVSTAVLGLTAHTSAGGRPDRPTAMPLISAVRGALDDARRRDLQPATYRLVPVPDAPVDTGPERTAQRPPAPRPTPAPVAPDATPLPAPASAQGAVEDSGSAAAATGVAAPPGSEAPAGEAAAGTLMWPVPGGEISQPFHAGHLALDIAAAPGSTVLASQGGSVTWAGWRDNGGGLVVEIDHGNGIVTVYNHLGSIWVAPGQLVAPGQGIGGVGCTGICTGPHVHYGVIVGGVFVNPLRYL